MSGCLLESVIIWLQTSNNVAMVHFTRVKQPEEFTGLPRCVETQEIGPKI